MSKRYDGSQRALDLKGLRVDPGGLLERSWKGCRGGWKGPGRSWDWLEGSWMVVRWDGRVLEGGGGSWKGPGRLWGGLKGLGRS